MRGGATRPRSESWAVFGIALSVRLAVVAWASGRIPPIVDGAFYQVIASRIANGQGYTWLWPDGVVTYAAHYPVGYPALLGAAYALFGSSPTVGMLLNATFGALGAYAAHRLLARYGRVALAGGLFVGIHPGLVGYTPALMTEVVAGSLVLVAASLASYARSVSLTASARGASHRRWLGALVGTGALLGIATLVRPQLVVVAPLIGFASAPPVASRRFAAALLVTAIGVLTCIPWTLRNCSRMGRCAFVSVNGGWNLLIGTNAEAHGGWAAVEVPGDEAGKDACFGLAARRRILSAPLGWVALMPEKLGATFDHCNAAGWYLHEANPTAFSYRAKVTLGVVETLFERVMLAGAIVASYRPRRAAGRSTLRRNLRKAAALTGVGLAFSPYGALAHLLLAAGLGLQAIRTRLRPLEVSAFAVLTSTMVIHAVFFGGGRYQLPVLAWTSMLAAMNLPSPRRKPRRQ
ncbi:MAG: hypothetical protein FJ096_05680 [Deltaproteobacteria bacterium]|nr:hypothetical protein [Deltaproteobacteria bacterium]